MKRILLILLAVILIISLAACKKNNFEAFMNASKKTDDIKRGQESIDLKMALDFNTEGLTPEEIKKLNYFRKIETKINTTNDEELNKTIGRIYFNFAGLGFDAVFYDDGEKSFLKMPIIGKYMVFDEEFIENYSKDINISNEENEFISEENFEEIKKKWLDMIKSDDVFAGKDSVMTTPDGEVKVTEYNIKLTDGQFKNLLNESLEIVYDDEAIKENIEKYMKQSDENDIDINSEEFFDNLKKGLEESEIENLSYKAYIDIDGYIVKESINFDIKFDGESSEIMKGFKYFFEINRWSIEKEQKFEFPQLTKENTLDQDEIEQGVPFMFEDVFEKNE